MVSLCHVSFMRSSLKVSTALTWSSLAGVRETQISTHIWISNISSEALASKEEVPYPHAKHRQSWFRKIGTILDINIQKELNIDIQEIWCVQNNWKLCLKMQDSGRQHYASRCRQFPESGSHRKLRNWASAKGLHLGHSQVSALSAASQCPNHIPTQAWATHW